MSMINKELQVIQNRACRLIFGLKKRDEKWKILTLISSRHHNDLIMGLQKFLNEHHAQLYFRKIFWGLQNIPESRLKINPLKRIRKRSKAFDPFLPFSLKMTFKEVQLTRLLKMIINF